MTPSVCRSRHSGSTGRRRKILRNAAELRADGGAGVDYGAGRSGADRLRGLALVDRILDRERRIGAVGHKAGDRRGGLRVPRSVEVETPDMAETGEEEE